MPKTFIAAMVNGRTPQVSYRGSQLAEWLQPKLGANEGVIVSHIPAANGVHWHLFGKHQTHLLPLEILGERIGFPEYPLRDRIPSDIVTLGALPQARLGINNRLFVLSASALQAQMAAQGIRYVAVCACIPDKPVVAWLREHPGFETVATLKDSGSQYFLFRSKGSVSGDETTDPKRVYASIEALRFLDWLAKHDRERARWYRARLANIPGYRDDLNLKEMTSNYWVVVR